MSLGEIAETPTVPSVSRILAGAVEYADQGPFYAIRIATLGTLDPLPIIAVVTPEHFLAEGAALIVLAGLIDPEPDAPRVPEPSWAAGEAADATGRAHRVIGKWASGHTTQQLRHLMEAAADRSRTWEQQ